MLNWINFLHLYQPPGQSEAVLNKIRKESYSRIVTLFTQYPKLKVTMNIAGALLEQLESQGDIRFLEEITTLVEKGRIELVGSAMYHPILPFLPQEEIRRQILLHDEISKRIFGKLYTPSGFFMPEMAYSAEVATIVAELGFTWTILDEAHLGYHPNPNIRYRIEGSGLTAIFRNRKFSKTFPPESIVENLSSIRENYIITAHDGELYGHWHIDDKGYYEKAFTHPEIEFLTASEYIGQLSTEESITPRTTHWEVSPDEERDGINFALWDHPNNTVHALLWKLAHFCIESVTTNSSDPNYQEARSRLDRGLASCSWWWAADLKPEGFSIVAWDPSVVERGAKELVQSIRSLQHMPSNQKIAAEKLYAQIVLTVWSSHWEKQEKSDILHP